MRDMDSYVLNYIESPFEQYQVKYRRKKTLEIIKILKPDNILEIGCGIDSIFNYMEGYKQFTVVEPAEFFYHKAIEDSKGCENIVCINDFFEQAVDKLKQIEPFDLIICSGLLHEVENPDKFIDKMMELCRENTMIHIDVPNALSFHRLLTYKAGKMASVYEKSEVQNKLQQRDIYDLEKLISFVDKKGFTVVDKGSYFPKFFTHEQMQRILDEKIIEPWVLDGLYGLNEYIGDYGSEIYITMKKA